MTRHFRLLLISAALTIAAAGFALMNSNDALEQTLASAPPQVATPDASQGGTP